MLPRSQRLSVAQFNEVMEKGRASHSSLFIIRAMPVSEKTRISATVPKKVAKTAAVRNSLRRRMYDAISPFVAAVVPISHAIVFAKMTALTADVAEISRSLKEVFVKAGLLK